MEVKMNSQQRSKWLGGMKALNQLNQDFDRIKSMAQSSAQVAQWFEQKTGALPPSWKRNADLRASIERRGKVLERKLSALNYAYMLIKTNTAFVTESQRYPGDFDIVTNKNPESDEIQEAIFRRSLDGLGLAFLAPFVPMIIKGAVFIGGAVLAYGCVDAVSEAVVESKQIEKEIVHVQAQLQKDMARDPDIFKQFTKMKANLAENSWFDSLKSAAGGAVGFAAVLLVGLLIFKYMSKDKDKS